MLKLNILSESQKKLFDIFKESNWLKEFYLAGGTALALQIGHRKSEDYDFFIQKDFNNEIILKEISKIDNFNLLSEDFNSLYISLSGIRVSFISYKYKLLEPIFKINNLGISGIRDIACNKISAILSRGTKKDFIDLFFILKQYSFDDILFDFKDKYGQDYYNKYLILKSLVYFEDAELQPMPYMVENIEWENLKNHFINIARKF